MFEAHKAGPVLNDRQSLNGDISRRSLLRCIGLGAAALGSAPLLAACGSGGSSAGGSKNTKFAIASFPGDAYFFDAINQANKDFVKHHLDVPKFVVPQGGPQAFQLLIAGAINGYAADTALLMATFAHASKGKRPVLVGFRAMTSTYGLVGGPKTKWLPPEASFNDKMHSLAGKTIGTSQIGSGGDQQLTLALESAGMSRSDVTVLAVGPTAQAIPNIKAGRVDAYATVQWTSARFIAQETGGQVIADFSEPGAPALLRDQAVLSIAVREDMALDRPEVVQNWLAAQDDARQWIVKNPAAAADLLNKTGLGGKAPDIATAYITDFLKNVEPNLKPMFKAPRDTVDHMIEIAIRLGKIKKGDVTYEELVPEFARA